MKDARLLKGLQTFFWYAGWLMVAVTVAAIPISLYMQTKVVAENTWAFRDTTTMLTQLRIVVGDVGQFAFAFLMSSVFGMLANREKIDFARSQRFLGLTVAMFTLGTLLGLIGWARFVFVNHGLVCSYDCGFNMQVLMVVSGLFSLVKAFSDALFALVIWVLYRHFTRMVEFEAEVV